MNAKFMSWSSSNKLAPSLYQSLVESIKALKHFALFHLVNALNIGMSLTTYSLKIIWFVFKHILKQHVFVLLLSIFYIKDRIFSCFCTLAISWWSIYYKANAAKISCSRHAFCIKAWTGNQAFACISWMLTKSTPNSLFKIINNFKYLNSTNHHRLFTANYKCLHDTSSAVYLILCYKMTAN